jgi:hypothetical protein
MLAEAELRRLAEAELNDYESICWLGQPDPVRLAAQQENWRSVCSGLAGIAVAVPVTYAFFHWGTLNVTDPRAGADVLVLVIPPLWYGAFKMLKPLTVFREAQSIAYAVTKDRLLIIGCWPNRRIQSWCLANVNGIERSTRPDGSGDLIFRLQGDDPDETSGTSRPQFVGIPDVRRAEKHIRDLIDESRRRNGRRDE